MGQKDLTAKQFESSPEVFADIINAFVYEGEQYVPTDQKIMDLDGMLRMLHALTGETNFTDNMEWIQEWQEKGEGITMRYALSKAMEEGREEGKLCCAKAFVAETVMQKQSKEFIIGILQTCFQLKEEEAVRLYQEETV